MATLLIIEDETELLHALEQLFVHDGYDVVAATDGEEGLRRFRQGGVDLVIVDVLLPRLDGFAVCREIRRDSDVPVIVTTALDDEGHQLQGFSLLADDYVTKPYSLIVMRERVRAVLRRCASRTGTAVAGAVAGAGCVAGSGGGAGTAAPGQAGAPPDVGEGGPGGSGLSGFGDIVVDAQAREVLRGGEPVALTRTEFDILRLLAEHPRRVFTRESLARQVWGYADDCGNKAINIHVMNLRRKLGADSVETVRGVGYRAGGRHG